MIEKARRWKKRGRDGKKRGESVVQGIGGGGG